MAEKTDRRGFLGKSLLGVAGIGAACSLEERTVLAALQDAPAGGNGADFVIAGMFDFQIEDDVKIAVDNVRKCEDRKRPWRA